MTVHETLVEYSDEKIDIKIFPDGAEIRIGEEIYRTGEIIKAIDEYGNVCFEGKIKFKKDLDAEGRLDFVHLGFLVVGTKEHTLIDFLDVAKSKGWKLLKEKN